MAEILNVEDVAKILKVSKRTVQREVKLGRLKAFSVGRALRFKAEAIEEYMKEQEVKPGEKVEDDQSAA